MNPNLNSRLEEARSEILMWSTQLDDKWQCLEEMAQSLNVGRDVLIPIRYEEVRQADDVVIGFATFMGMKKIGLNWCLCMGIGPQNVAYWEEPWEWIPLARWNRDMSVEAAEHVDELVEMLTESAEVKTAEVEEAAAMVSQAIGRLV
jgi:hypothetical protein